MRVGDLLCVEASRETVGFVARQDEDESFWIFWNRGYETGGWTDKLSDHLVVLWPSAREETAP